MAADRAGAGVVDHRLAGPSLRDLVGTLGKPRAAWVTAATFCYRDDIARAAALEHRGIHYPDAGTSGGVRGLERGFCLMIGVSPR